MTEETTLLSGQAPPTVRDWPTLDQDGTDFDPILADLMREGPLARIRLPFGVGWAWLATRYEDVRLITNDPRFSRAGSSGRVSIRYSIWPQLWVTASPPICSGPASPTASSSLISPRAIAAPSSE